MRSRWSQPGFTLLLFVAFALVFPPAARAGRPDPAGWYAGDLHAHRSCGGPPVSVSSIHDAMVAEDLDVVSLLADMGNGEVQNPLTDLPRVNGADDPASTPGRIIHWDAEWHWDATYTQYPHQALGGHLVALGLGEAHTIWQESTFPILDWAHRQGGIAGFAHLQYLDDEVPASLTCCTPIEYPVEVALGAADFVSEDVEGGDSAIHAYYRLLNCGFRPGFAAGSDYPCGSEIGPSLTYAQVTGGPFGYRAWLDAIARGRTVVSRVGRTEFLDLSVNDTATPGDEVALAAPGAVTVRVRWTVTAPMARTLELVRNGAVVSRRDAAAAPGTADSLTTSVSFDRSGWLCARVTGAGGHEVHTAAVFVTVAGKPVRASTEDAEFYVRWMDTLLLETSPGGAWNGFFPTDLTDVQTRYAAARDRYRQIADEAAAGRPHTIFQPGDTPAEENVNDGQPIEVGVKFRSTTDGWVGGIRFYKGADNTGPHAGHLWTAGGTLLATASFDAESDFGWQEADFPSPVAISANTTLVASYHSDGGGYSDTPGYFTSAVIEDPLRALADGEEGGNGVYCYGANLAFPDDSYEGTNYWVDVTFLPETGPAAVTATTPVAPALLVSPNPSRGAPALAIVSPAGGSQTVEVLDVAGRVRRVLTHESAVAGRWTLRWDGRDAAGRALPAGLYFARLRAAGRTVVTRFAIVP